MAEKRLTLLDRCFMAADRWIANRKCILPDERGMHIAYRCGYGAGYEAAKRDARKRR